MCFFSQTDDILDTLLDQHDVEVDPLDRMEGDTPLHKAVRFSNDSASSAAADTISSDSGAKDLGHAMVEMLIDAGADPRVRNKGKLKAVELVDPRDTGLRVVLQKAEYAMLLGDDHAGFDEGGEEKDAGSGSD